jgi:hypothetical protein
MEGTILWHLPGGSRQKNISSRRRTLRHIVSSFYLSPSYRSFCTASYYLMTFECISDRQRTSLKDDFPNKFGREREKTHTWNGYDGGSWKAEIARAPTVPGCVFKKERKTRPSQRGAPRPNNKRRRNESRNGFNTQHHNSRIGSKNLLDVRQRERGPFW